MSAAVWMQIAGGVLEVIALGLVVYELVTRSRVLRTYEAPKGVTVHAPVLGHLHATAPMPTASVVGTVAASSLERIAALERSVSIAREDALAEARRMKDHAEQTARDVASQVEAVAAAELKKVEELLTQVTKVDAGAYLSAGCLLLGLTLQIVGSVSAGLAAGT